MITGSHYVNIVQNLITTSFLHFTTPIISYETPKLRLNSKADKIDLLKTNLMLQLLMLSWNAYNARVDLRWNFNAIFLKNWITFLFTMNYFWKMKKSHAFHILNLWFKNSVQYFPLDVLIHHYSTTHVMVIHVVNLDNCLHYHRIPGQ